jgi:hypothetical protein
MRRHRGTTFVRSARRKRVWADTNGNLANATAIGGVDLLAGYRAVAGASSAGSTVLAVNMQFAGNFAGTSTLVTAWHLGLYVDESNRTAALLDSPGGSPYVDWMWNYKFYFAIGTAAYLVSPDLAGSVRLKAKRKIEEVGSTLWLSALPVLGGATNLSLDFHARVLLALP